MMLMGVLNRFGSSTLSKMFCPKFAALKRLNTSNISSRRGSLPRRKSLFTRTSTL